MNLHRPFKMDSSSYLPTPLASPALMVLASTAEAGRDASVPCQAPRSFGVPVSIDKDLHLPFPSASYTFTSMYHRQGPISGAFSSRDFPASLLHLHPQFASPNLDCSSLGMLNHSGVGAFRPFSSPPEEREVGRYNSAFTPAKRPKGCYADSEGKGYEFGTPGGSLQAVADDTARKPFAVSGLLSDGEGSSSPEEYKDGCLKGLFDSQSPMCPVCQAILRPGEMQEHMEEEMARLKQLHISAHSAHGDHLLGTSKSLSLSLQIKYEGGSSNPRSPEDLHSDRYQTFLRVRANRHTRLNVDDLYWCRCYTKPAPLRPHNGAHLAPDYTQVVRIGKLKRRKPEEGHHDGPTDLGRDEDEWSEKRRMTSILGGFKGAVMLSSRKARDGRDSDVDLDVDGDDTMEYGRAQYTETDVIPCATEERGDVEGREVGITSVGLEADQLTLDCSKWKNEGSPSTSNGESNKLDNSMSILNTTCKNSNIEMVSEDCALTTLDALKARIRDLEKQLSKGDRYKCLICMDTYTTPLTSIQCWHVHCEECWLRTLGAKKLCPQCNTITSPGDLRRVYL